MSGIVALFFSGICHSHYTYYSASVSAQVRPLASALQRCLRSIACCRVSACGSAVIVLSWVCAVGVCAGAVILERPCLSFSARLLQLATHGISSCRATKQYPCLITFCLPFACPLTHPGHAAPVLRVPLLPLRDVCVCLPGPAGGHHAGALYKLPHLLSWSRCMHACVPLPMHSVCFHAVWLTC